MLIDLRKSRYSKQRSTWSANFGKFLLRVIYRLSMQINWKNNAQQTSWINGRQTVNNYFILAKSDISRKPIQYWFIISKVTNHVPVNYWIVVRNGIYQTTWKVPLPTRNKTARTPNIKLKTAVLKPPNVATSVSYETHKHLCLYTKFITATKMVSFKPLTTWYHN